LSTIALGAGLLDHVDWDSFGILRQYAANIELVTALHGPKTSAPNA